MTRKAQEHVNNYWKLFIKHQISSDWLRLCDITHECYIKNTFDIITHECYIILHMNVTLKINFILLHMNVTLKINDILL